MAKETGGTAFPYAEHNGDGSVYADHYGMTLRDYFAAKMLPVLVSGQWPLSAIGIKLKDGMSDVEQYASAAYEFADAMIAERAQ